MILPHLQRRGPPLQGTFYLGDQFAVVHTFGNVIVGSLAHCLDRSRRVSNGGHHHDGRVAVLGNYLGKVVNAGVAGIIISRSIRLNASRFNNSPVVTLHHGRARPTS